MEEQKKQKQANIRKVVIGTLLVVALYFGGKKVVFSITHETTDNAQIETSIVPVLTRIAGYVKTISIKDYDSVGQNQLVAEIDDAELQMQLEEQKADLQQSLADVSNAQAQLENGILALKNNKVPCEIHFYEKGSHGFGLGNNGTSKNWTKQCEEWLKFKNYASPTDIVPNKL